MRQGEPHSPIMQIVRAQLSGRRFSWELQIAAFELIEKLLPKRLTTTRNEKLRAIRERWYRNYHKREIRVDGSFISNAERDSLIKQ